MWRYKIGIINVKLVASDYLCSDAGSRVDRGLRHFDFNLSRVSHVRNRDHNKKQQLNGDELGDWQATANCCLRMQILIEVNLRAHQVECGNHMNADGAKRRRSPIDSQTESPIKSQMNERSPFTSAIRSLMRPPCSQEYWLSYTTSSPSPAEHTGELKLAELRSCHLLDNYLLKRLYVHVIGRLKSMLQMLVLWLRKTFKIALTGNINLSTRFQFQ